MLLLRFAIWLENHAIHRSIRPHGVLFYRWLPSGRDDAINIPVEDSRDSLRIWFERRGYIEDGLVRFDYSREEVDEAVMVRQGKLESGPLRGEAVFAHVTEEELQAIRDERTGSEEYIALGKRIVAFLYPPVSNFISLLRMLYGQYWIPELNEWDSREVSLGYYCGNVLNLSWSDDDGSNWHRFIPTDQAVTFIARSLPGRGYAEYLAREDWHRLRSEHDLQEKPSLAMITLAQAHDFLAHGHLRQAFVEGVTALELAIIEYIGRRQESGSRISQVSKGFFDLNLPVRVAILGSLSGAVGEETLEYTLNAIDIRNKIVHEGLTPTQGEQPLKALFQTAVAFLELEECKFPLLIAGNELAPPTA